MTGITFTEIDRQMVGQRIMLIYTVTNDAATDGSVKTGLSDVLFADTSNSTAAKANIVKKNYYGTVATKGSVNITTASGDSGVLIVIGVP